MDKGTHEALRTRRVHFGPGSLDKLKDESEGREKAFVVTGRSLNEETDLVRRVEGLLGGKHSGTCAGISQHTPAASVKEAAKLAAGADLLVSVGGGSVIDGTKAVSRELGYVAQVAVPTTLSVAELAHLVGVTNNRGRKAGFVDRRAVPEAVIYDPQMTVHTPEKLWLSTGIRALDHAVEGYLYGGPHPVTDVTVLEGMSRLMQLLPQSRARPDDIEVRGELQVAAWLSYFAPANNPMGLSHNLGKRLGASYGIPHGVTSCITLAPSLGLAEDDIEPRRWRALSDALGGEPDGRVASLVLELGLPNSISEFDVPESDLEAIASEYEGQEDRALAILKRAY
ncbi:iron-containing alcohol dehydrogenase [Rubrobacter indicoceani]|uniref:iron-containing alcohol dehydrogenase n=1 Tax=Rubrobacter indicoceani TaxID=2051957 RepID=UPI000E5C4E2D|nr:iron-containing alcohol dehydrogenase [Rubrobacter indicoceani]